MHHNNDDFSLDKLLQGISIEATEADAIMFLAIYYRDNDDYDSAASYVFNIYICDSIFFTIFHVTIKFLPFFFHVFFWKQTKNHNHF